MRARWASRMRLYRWGFERPARRHKEGQVTGGRDVRGGLESVPGVEEGGIPVRNYRPSWSLKYPEMHAPNVPPSKFKFFRAPSGEPIP